MVVIFRFLITLSVDVLLPATPRNDLRLLTIIGKKVTPAQDALQWGQCFKLSNHCHNPFSSFLHLSNFSKLPCVPKIDCKKEAMGRKFEGQGTVMDPFTCSCQTNLLNHSLLEGFLVTIRETVWYFSRQSWLGYHVHGLSLEWFVMHWIPFRTLESPTIASFASPY